MVSGGKDANIEKRIHRQVIIANSSFLWKVERLTTTTYPRWPLPPSTICAFQLLNLVVSASSIRSLPSPRATSLLLFFHFGTDQETSFHLTILLAFWILFCPPSFWSNPSTSPTSPLDLLRSQKLGPLYCFPSPALHLGGQAIFWSFTSYFLSRIPPRYPWKPLD